MLSGLHALVLFPFALALVLPLLFRRLRRRVGWAVLPFPAAATVYLFTLFPRITEGETFGALWEWAPGYGISFSLLLDGFNYLFTLLIAGIGTLVIAYSIFYLDAREDLNRFYICILLFMGAMFGVVLSENLLTLYLFWEITSISSFLLIGFWHTLPESRNGALKSMLVTVSGGLCLLAGFVLLGLAGGTYSLRELLDQAPAIQSHAYYPAIVLLVLVGAFTKSAQVPFHLWLPGAMAAPTPVSAYLHSATMVKAGIFLTAKAGMILGGTELWFYTVVGVGIVTLLLGSYLAVQQRDLKGLLAFSTVSQLGLILTMFGYGTTAALIAGVSHILNHALFKGSLFMLVGIIDHETGTREIPLLSGLGRKMPVTGALMFIGALSMAGIPLLNGFISKELILQAMLEPPFAHNLFTRAVPVLAVVGSAFTALYSLILTLKIFLGPLTESTPRKPHEAPWGLLLPPALLATLVVALGVAPQLFSGSLVSAGVTSLTGETTPVHLALWHGINAPLLMSLAALLLGVLMYVGYPRVTRVLQRISDTRFNMNALYEWALGALEHGSKAFTRRIMTGYLRDYLVYILGFAAVLVGYALLRSDATRQVFRGLSWGEVSWSEWATFIVLIAGTLTAVFVRQRLAVALAVGSAGLMVAFLWLFWEAPDLALTQTVVETVTIVPLFLAFGFLPKLRKRSKSRHVEGINVVVAVAFGLVAGLFTLVADGTRLFSSIGDYFIDNALPLAGGTNVVNVILVDFRGFDTMIETTVLAVVGAAVYTLVYSRRRRQVAAESEKRSLMINPVILPAVSRVLFYLVLVFSLYIFFRGHNHPGGGFVAGVMTAAAIIIWALAYERPAAMALMPVHPRFIIGTGLLIIVGLGLGAVALGYPFLTQTFGHIDVPYLGRVELATAVLFDLGVWAIVSGSIFWMVAAMSDGVPLEHQAIPERAGESVRKGESTAWKS